jgi:DMSO/TMAO reductase YedYZ molybdopterin-dependent catalytic subunit
LCTSPSPPEPLFALRMRLIVTLLLMGLPHAALRAQGAASAPRTTSAAPGIRIEGDVPRAITLSADQIRALPRQRIRATDHGKPPATYEGVALADVLGQAGVEFGATLRGPRLASYLVVEAADGYRAVFALAELDSAFVAEPVLLVDTMDGQPLPAAAGPYRIVAPNEKRPARWVRQVTVLRVLTTPAAAAPKK